jgi:hypothetical protein
VNGISASRLEALAAWNRRGRDLDTLRLQVFASGAWRNVLVIDPEQSTDYVDALEQIAELLPQVRWRLIGPGQRDIVIGGVG